MKPQLLLLALAAAPATAQTLIEDARLSGTTTVEGTLAMGAQSTFSSAAGWVLGGLTDPVRLTLTTPLGAQLEFREQTSPSVNLLYWPGTLQAGSFTGDGTGLTTLNPTVVWAAVQAAATPLVINEANSATSAHNQFPFWQQINVPGGTDRVLVRQTPDRARLALQLHATSRVSAASLRTTTGATGAVWWDGSASMWGNATPTQVLGAELWRLLSATVTWDVPSLAPGATATTTIAVAGCTLSDSVAIGLPATRTSGLVFTAWVSAAGTVTLEAVNASSATRDAPSGTYRVTTFSFEPPTIF